MLFSQRKRFKPVREVIQKDEMDINLRNGLWNCVYNVLLRPIDNSWGYRIENDGFIYEFYKDLWVEYFKETIDDIHENGDDVINYIKNYFFDCEWYEVYDFIEFTMQNFWKSSEFDDYINPVLKKEISAYRLVDKIFIDITSEEEIKSIEEAVSYSNKWKPVSIHINSALEKMSDRESPDYRNSIKESISAVEAAAKIITKKENATLGDALKILKKEYGLTTSLEQAFHKLYGYTNNEEGIRHSLSDESKLDQEEAKFMLVTCSAFVNYLKSKFN